MAYATPSTSDLGTFLGIADSMDVDRGMLLLTQAENLCTAIINPLPDGAQAVVLSVAARAYMNPGNVSAQAADGYTVSYSTAAGGLWLSRADKRTLRLLNGGGGAFTIDTIPADAGQGLPWWDRNVGSTQADVGWMGPF